MELPGFLPSVAGSCQVHWRTVNVRREALRAQILRTAADLFRERGYRATTLDNIAGRLGMSKASLYTYFRAKEEMLAVISRETIASFTRELSLVLRSTSSRRSRCRPTIPIFPSRM